MGGSNLRSAVMDKISGVQQMVQDQVSSMTGGKKMSKKHSKKSRRTRKAGSSCGSRKSKKGGMGFAGVIHEALVPFGLFALQKRKQRRTEKKKSVVKKKKTFRKK